MVWYWIGLGFETGIDTGKTGFGNGFENCELDLGMVKIDVDLGMVWHVTKIF